MVLNMTTITENFTNVKTRIDLAVANASICAKNIQILAVSKKQSPEKIIQLYELGQRDFGENYLQEAIDKQRGLRDLAIVWHFIGHIQSNKTRQIAQHFTWAHSVDRLKIAERLSRQRLETQPPLNICLQVNINNEASKSGFNKGQVLHAAEQIATLPNLSLRGLMAIPDAKQSASQQMQTMSEMHQLFEDIQELGIPIDTLSMGMSRDLEIAIQAGATMLRIGEALFGARAAL